MNISNTDRKYIDRLFELKPDATGRDVVKLIERLGKWDTRHDLKFAVDRFIKEEILNSNGNDYISVNDHLPEERKCNDGYIEPSDYVLVVGNNGSYGVSRYWGNRRSKGDSPNTYKDWMDLDWVAQKVIGWMPILKPDMGRLTEEYNKHEEEEIEYE